jgi:N-acylglucosamine 2-epimerase
MKKSNSRRNFLKQNTLTGMGVVLLGGLGGCATIGLDSKYVNRNVITHIGDKTLGQLRDKYHSELFDHFLPNMDRLVVDHEFGGFMCSLDITSGKQLASDKRAWFEGRGIWVYSYLYNNLEKKPEYLEIARKSKDFILKHQPKDDSFWIASYTREGSPIGGPGDIFGNLYIAEGLAEFSKASGERQYMELAKKINLTALDRYDSPEYKYASEKKVTGPRFVNHWMVMLRNSTQILEQEADTKIEQLAERCVDAIMNYHLNPEYNLLNLTLTHDLHRISDIEYSQSVSLGINIQALWMVLSEAVRKKDSKLFQRAQELFRRHVIVARDPVYGGYFNSLDHANNFTFNNLGKVQSSHMEVLNGTLLLIEHTGDVWAENCFAETYAYVQDKFAHPEYAFPVESGDRTLTKYSKGMGNYHYPRSLMMSLAAFNRMVSRKGQVSKLFD